MNVRPAVGQAISELVATPDGFVLAQHEGEVGANEMIGVGVDLNRNLLTLIEVLRNDVRIAQRPCHPT